MQQAYVLQTISHDARVAHAHLTLQAFDARPIEMDRRASQYASSQRSPQSAIIAQGVREVKGGQITQYIAWWEFADGSYEEFDGVSWSRKRPAAQSN